MKTCGGVFKLVVLFVKSIILAGNGPGKRNYNDLWNITKSVFENYNKSKVAH